MGQTDYPEPDGQLDQQDPSAASCCCFTGLFQLTPLRTPKLPADAELHRGPELTNQLNGFRLDKRDVLAPLVLKLCVFVINIAVILIKHAFFVGIRMKETTNKLPMFSALR